MQPVPLLALITPLCLATACAEFSPSVPQIRLAPPDTTLTTPCPRLSRDPGRSLSQADVETLWSRDRAAHAVCTAKHDAMVRWAQGVVEAISEGTDAPP